MKINHWNFRGFTLIELLVVMGLMGILLAVAMPSFGEIMRGRAQTQACTEIAGQLQLARNYAIQNHCYTAVVFPTMNELMSELKNGSANEKYESGLVNYFNAACRVAIIAKDTNGKYNFVMWMPGGEWVRLPKGAAIMDGSSNFDTLSQKLRDVQIGVLERLYRKDLKKDSMVSDADVIVDMARYVAFRPNGQIIMSAKEETDSASGQLKIRVADAGFDYAKKKLVQLKRNKTYFYQCLLVDPLTGRTKQTIERN